MSKRNNKHNWYNSEIEMLPRMLSHVVYTASPQVNCMSNAIIITCLVKRVFPGCNYRICGICDREGLV